MVEKAFERNSIYWRKSGEERKRLKRLKSRTIKFKYSSSNSKKDKRVVTLRYHIGNETFNVLIRMHNVDSKIANLKLKYKNGFKLCDIYLERPR